MPVDAVVDHDRAGGRQRVDVGVDVDEDALRAVEHRRHQRVRPAAPIGRHGHVVGDPPRFDDDLRDLGAELRQEAGRGRAGHAVTELEDGHPGEERCRLHPAKQ